MAYNVIHENANGIIEPFLDVGTWTDLFSDLIGFFVKIARSLFMDHYIEATIYYPEIDILAKTIEIKSFYWKSANMFPPLIEIFAGMIIAFLAFKALLSIIQFIKG